MSDSDDLIHNFDRNPLDEDGDPTNPNLGNEADRYANFLNQNSPIPVAATTGYYANGNQIGHLVPVETFDGTGNYLGAGVPQSNRDFMTTIYGIDGQEGFDINDGQNLAVQPNSSEVEIDARNSGGTIYSAVHRGSGAVHNEYSAFVAQEVDRIAAEFYDEVREIVNDQGLDAEAKQDSIRSLAKSAIAEYRGLQDTLRAGTQNIDPDRIVFGTAGVVNGGEANQGKIFVDEGLMKRYGYSVEYDSNGSATKMINADGVEYDLTKDSVRKKVNKILAAESRQFYDRLVDARINYADGPEIKRLGTVDGVTSFEVKHGDGRVETIATDHVGTVERANSVLGDARPDLKADATGTGLENGGVGNNDPTADGGDGAPNSGTGGDGDGSGSGTPNSTGSDADGTPNSGDGSNSDGTPNSGDGSNSDGTPNSGDGSNSDGTPNSGDGSNSDGTPNAGDGSNSDGTPNAGDGSNSDGDGSQSGDGANGSQQSDGSTTGGEADGSSGGDSPTTPPTTGSGSSGDATRGILTPHFDFLNDVHVGRAYLGAGALGLAAAAVEVAAFLNDDEARQRVTDAFANDDFDALGEDIAGGIVEGLPYGLGAASFIALGTALGGPAGGALAAVVVAGAFFGLAVYTSGEEALEYFNSGRFQEDIAQITSNSIEYFGELALIAVTQGPHAAIIEFYTDLFNVATEFLSDLFALAVAIADSLHERFEPLLSTLQNNAQQNWQLLVEDIQDTAAFFAEIISPLVIDMDGDGVELVALESSSAFFDLNIDGFAEATGWVNPDDALLGYDVNGNGFIDDNRELFGDQTGFANGFLALAEHDLNSDGVIDASDAIFGDLLVWQDANSDGFSDPSEMRSLSEVGIASIDLGASSISETNAGNDVLWRSDVTWSDGSVTNVDDVYFQTDARASIAILPDDFQFHVDAFRLPMLFGYGQIASTIVRNSEDISLRADAISLVSLASAGDITGFLSAFDDYLFAWAGVDGVDPTSRGEHIDARILAFLEKAYGTDYVQQPHGHSDPRHAAADALVEQFNELSGKLAIRFLAQTAKSDALMSSSSIIEFDATFAAHPFSNWSGLVAGYAPASRNLEGDFEPVFNSLVSLVQTNTLSPTEVIQLLSLADADLETSSTAFAETIAALIATDGSSASRHLGVGLDAHQSGLEVAVGYSGDDILSSTEAGYFIGAEGNDTLLGGTEADIYIYAAGDGSDLIVDQQGSYTRPDQLVFSDLNASDVSFDMNSDGDLVIAVPDGNTITIDRHFDFGFSSSSSFEMETIAFADGTVLGFDAIRHKTTADQKPSGSVEGTKHADAYAHTSGDGSYVISDPGHNSFVDSLTFTDIASNGVVFGRSGDDLQLSLSSGEIVTLASQFQQDFGKISFSKEFEIITFSDGVSFDTTDIRQRSIADQKASGSVVGTTLSETYSHALGDGSYTIYDYSTGSDRADRLNLTNVVASDVVFEQTPGADLAITFSNGEIVTIIDYFQQAFGRVRFDNEIEEIAFSDGTVLTKVGVQAKVDADAAAAASSADPHADDKAAGTVQGSEQADSYVHASGDGSYTIYDWDNNGRTDRFTFTDLNIDQVSFAQTSGIELVMTTATGDVITINNHFDEDLDEAIEEIAFADGTVLDMGGIRIKSTADQKASGVVIGDDYWDHYFHASGDGSYTIYDWDNNGRTDRFTFTDLNIDQVSFAQTSGIELVMTTATGDVITINNHFDEDLDEAIEEIAFADGTVLDMGGIRIKSTADQKASGVVIGDDYWDHYFHASGDGSYTIYDWDNNGRTDRFTFTDLNIDQVSFAQTSGIELVMTTATGDVITINNHFDEDLDEAIEEIAFADGTVLDMGGIRIKSTADQKASGVVIGDDYWDHYFHASGDGSYTIYDWDNNGRTDRFTFTDLNIDQVSFAQTSGIELVMTTATGDVITINNHSTKTLTKPSKRSPSPMARSSTARASATRRPMINWRRALWSGPASMITTPMT